MSGDQEYVLERRSPYVSNYDNPIRYSDPKGDCPSCLVGALIGELLRIMVFKLPLTSLKEKM